MAKEVSLKITYSQAPGVRKPTVEKLHQDIKEAGYGFFQKNPEYGPSFLLFSSGVKSNQLAGEIKKAPEKGLDIESISLLEDVNLKLKTFEQENPELFRDLSETYYEGVSQIEITEEVGGPGQYISLKPSADNTYYEFSPGPSLDQAGIDIGPAREAASFALNKIAEPVKKKIVEAGVKVATKAVTKAAVGTATKVGVQAAAQAVGSTVPIIGNIIAFITTTVIAGIIDRALIAAKKRARDVEDAVGGAIIASLQFLGLLGGILSATFSTILGMVIVIIISIPFTIAYILFIINSGAYLVPPSQILAPGENPYIEITKVASETEFENSDLPISVTYTITVTPLRGSLTNISISHVCEILSRRPTDDCPAPTDPAPVLISPATPYVYTYTVTYTQADADYRDSLVLNTFSVTADTDEVSQTTATGAASVIIGNPPTECYTFDGSWDASSQAQGYKNTLLGAITTLTSNYTPFAQKVCTGGQLVRLEYTQNLGCPGAWACAFRSSVIRFNGGGLNNPNSALYILTHESGHIVNYRLDSLYQERPSICSYAPARTEAAEAFAESAALYVASTRCTTPSTYPSLYPAHYSFADQVLF